MGIRLTRSDFEFLASLEPGTCVKYHDLHSSFRGRVESVITHPEVHTSVVVVNNVTAATGKFKGRQKIRVSLIQWATMRYSDDGATYHSYATRATVTFGIEE